MTRSSTVPPREEAVLRARLGELATVLATGPVTAPQGEERDVEPRPAHRPGLLLAAAALLVVGAVAAAVAWISDEGDDRPTEVATEEGTPTTAPPVTTTTTSTAPPLPTTAAVPPGPDRPPGPDALSDALTARFPSWFAGLRLDPATQAPVVLYDQDAPAPDEEEIDAVATEHGYGPDQYTLEAATWTRAELLAVEDELLAAFPDSTIPGTGGTITGFGVAADRGFVEIQVTGVDAVRATEVLASRLPRDLISVVEGSVMEDTSEAQPLRPDPSAPG